MEQIITLRIERDQAIASATPIVKTPITITTPPAKAFLDATLGETPATPPKSTSSSRLSERLPDPAIFQGDKKEFRRFVSKIHQKMKTNADRFPTAIERMSYVTNRLEGPAYGQVLPYILDGECQLSDYPDILRILDRAYGDPNLVNNSKKEFYRLKQANREFAPFYADFQRLAIEGEVSLDSQITTLEAAISRELRAQLTNVDAPDGDIHEFARFLQKLENKRRYYNDPTDFNPRSPANRNTTTTQSPRLAPQKEQPQGDPMDLSVQRYSSRPDKETGNCYRCHRPGHRIRDCPLPDTRPVEVQKRDEANRQRRINEIQYTWSPSPRQKSPRRTPSPKYYSPVAQRTATPNLRALEQENGARLE